MNYQLVDGKSHLLIRISGNTKKNEPLLVMRTLYPYLRRKNRKVIVNLKGLATIEPVILAGVLHSIKKEVDLCSGELTLCYLSPEITLFFVQHGLDRVFKICNDEEDAAA